MPMVDTRVAGAALGYATLGWAVVPVHTIRDGRCSCGRVACPAPGKHPRVRWERYEREAPRREQVAAWWRRWPDANIGVVTGPVSHLVVLDVDPRHGGDASLFMIEERWGVAEPTVESETGGGGRHLWFHADEPFATATIAPGCEVKGAGGMVVAPPSVHPSGRAYRWRTGHAPGDLAPAPPPRWLTDLERTGDRMPEGRDRLRAADESVRTADERDTFAQLWARAGVALRPGDHNYLCPFHDDHHPSLHVDADCCRWFCFACRIGGGTGALRRRLGAEAQPRHRARIRATHETCAPRDEPITLDGDVEVDAVGESAHQDALLALTGGVRSYAGVDVDTAAELVADPHAPLDPDAVAVVIAERVVGRLRRADARCYRPVFTAVARAHGSVRCRARILGGWDRGRGDVGAFGVRVVLPALDDGPRE